MDAVIPERRRILVVGATGKQGGAVLQALLQVRDKATDFEVLALTRKPTSKAAVSLASDDRVRLLNGDLDHPSAIFEQAGGTGSIWGVFSVQLPDTKTDPYSNDNREYKQGKELIDASLKYGVQHFVQTSVDRGGSRSDNNPTPIPHFITKHRIEGYLREKTQNSDMTYTILRPVAFMDILKPTFLGRLFAAVLVQLGNKPLQFVATKDIGIFAAQAFDSLETDEYKNTAIGLAGDEVTVQQCNDIFWKTLHRPMPMTYGFLGSFLTWMIPEVRIMFDWFKEEGYGVDIERCRKLNAKMLDFASYIKEEGGFRT